MVTPHHHIFLLIASCESTSKTLETLSSNTDAVFDLSCVTNRIETLIPVLESTERCVRVEYLKDLKDTDGTVSSGIMKKLDILESIALRVWNVVDMRVKECECKPKVGDSIEWRDEFMKVAMSIKYFVCLLLTIHALLRYRDLKGFMRVLKCLFRVYHECTDYKDLKNGKFTKDCVEKVFNYIETFDEQSTNQHRDSLEILKIEFLVLDMQNAFISNNISMAKFYEAKANLVANCGKMKNENIFNVCRTLYNDGLLLYQDEKYQDSHYFLERCYLVMEKIGDRIRTSGPENKIKVSTLTMLTKCCIKLNTEESMNKATKLIKLLQLQKTERLESLKLQIEMIEFQKIPAQQVEDMIMTIIIAFPADVQFLKQVRMIFNSFSYKDPVIAKQSLLYIFTNKINFEDSQFDEVSESYFISLIWIITSQMKGIGGEDEQLSAAQKLLEIADKKITKELSIETVFCVMILLWSQGKKCMKKNDYNGAKQWFLFCFARPFEVECQNGDKDDITLGKIQRSLLECCIKTQDYNRFDTVYQGMSKYNQCSPITLYFRFLAVLHNRQEDWVETATGILEQVSTLDDTKSVEILALCVIEAKEITVQMDPQTANDILAGSMKILLDKCESVDDPKRDPLVIVALRASVYVYGKGIENDLNKSRNDIDNIVRSVNQFIHYVEGNRANASSSDLLNDYEWFASSCYNYGLLLVENNLMNEDVANLFKCVLALFELLPEEARGKYMKWRSKSIIFKCLCEKHQLKNNPKEKMKWLEIQEQNQNQLQLLKSQFPGEMVNDIAFQHQLLVNESMVARKRWSELLRNLKDDLIIDAASNLALKIHEIDSIMEILLDVDSDSIAPGDYDGVKRILDVVIMEKGFNPKFNLPERRIFKWIYLIINKLLPDQLYFEACIKEYIVNLKNLLESNNAQVEQNKRDQEDDVKDFEIEWIAGMTWNRGVEIVLNRKRGGSDVKHSDPDSSIPNISTDDSCWEPELDAWYGPASKKRKLSKIASPDRGAPTSASEGWCELAIAVSALSLSHVQHDRMVRLIDQLR